MEIEYTIKRKSWFGIFSESTFSLHIWIFFNNVIEFCEDSAKYMMSIAASFCMAALSKNKVLQLLHSPRSVRS